MSIGKTDDGRIRKLLSCKATLEEKKQLSEMQEVEQIMKTQWKGSHDSADERTGNRIWKQIAKRAYTGHQKYNSSPLWTRYAACASIVLLIGAIWFAWHSSQKPMTEYKSVFAREHCVLTLPDKSKVWIQAGSTLQYAKTFNKSREVWLKGDATFEVTKKTGSPFRVYVNKAFVEVKGTAFRVSNRKEELSKVTLFNGLVDFHPATGKIVTMHPSQHITYNNKNEEVTLSNISNIGWQNGVYKFNDMRLDSLVNIIRYLYETDVVLGSNVPHHHLFTGTIRYNERPSEVVEKICYNMNLKYKRNHNKLIIYMP